MITAIRPYTVQNRQKQNFEAKYPKEFLQACREGDVEVIERAASGTPHIYTISENQGNIKEILADPTTVITQTLKKLARRLNIPADSLQPTKL